MGRGLGGAVVCSMLVLPALLALAASQPATPALSPAQSAPRPPPAARASSPVPAAPAPRQSSPPVPAVNPSSPPPAAPAGKPSPSPRPAPVPPPPRAAPTPRPLLPPASPVPVPAAPRPAPKPSPPAAPAPGQSQPPATQPPPPSSSLAPRPSPSPATPAPQPPPAPKQSPSPASPKTPPPPQPSSNSTPSTISTLAQLSPSFYAQSCPGVELAVRDVVRSASTLDPSIPGKLLRLVFHDCFVEGCDASVLIQGNGTERTDPANLSLGGFNVIDAAKRLLEVVCPATVSCSDIIVLAARDAVVFTGGPSVPVPLGRRDGLVSLASNVRRNIIDTGFSVDAMAASFTFKGLTLDDLVTLSGGHTIGSAHCNTFRERFQVANGSMAPVDASMNADYANELIRACAASAGAAVDCDSGSASAFDNRYFANLLAGRGLLRTDAVLVRNATTRAKVEEFARSQEGFFASWAGSYARLTSLGVKTGADGEIRRTCSSVNG
ncbi:peroxidase 18-like [Panicum virgatum]|uniref:peroxidase n=1 Tax=Panicum virgatum TaxID=38727 RepID=A0A8T0QDV1_PANVG|nr:peroxidase 18-like [Panicum virgatum]KAG2573091.1 hypothetical protein PVAP13_7KG226900 [Panicum virgatum]